MFRGEEIISSRTWSKSSSDAVPGGIHRALRIVKAKSFSGIAQDDWGMLAVVGNKTQQV